MGTLHPSCVTNTAIRTMFHGLTLLPLLLSLQETDAMPSKCCGAKTVGEYSYTLIDTDAIVPKQCKDSCAYTRDDQKGSMYCFAVGEEVVECQGEMPVNWCYPRYGGCPPKKNVRIGGYNAIYNTKTDRYSYQECWDYCRWLCAISIDDDCDCKGWSWDSSNNTCYTYPGDCYEEVEAEGFWSGGLCYEPTTTIKEFSESVNFTTNPPYKKTVGNLISATTKFDDSDLGDIGPVIGVDWYIGEYSKFGKVVTGIQVRYRDNDGILRGSSTNEKHSITLTKGQFISAARGTSRNNLSPAALIYSLGFDNSEELGTIYGDQQRGKSFKAQKKNYELSFINGTVTNDASPQLGSVTFTFNLI